VFAKLYSVLIESDVEARTPCESVRPYAPACENDITIHDPAKPPRSPSIVAALTAWQRQRVFCASCQPVLHVVISSPPLDCCNVRHGVCSSSDGLMARLAVPDANRVSLDCGLSAECADVSGVLGDFHLLDLLSEGGTVSTQRERLATR
jgi:hypothetical protein